MARRKKSSDGGGGGYSWMDTYGDLVTLLLCFFVLLFASSTVDAAKFQQIIAAFQGTAMPYAIPFDPGPANNELPVQLPEGIATTPPEPTPTATLDPSDPQAEIHQKFGELYDRLTEYIEENEMQGKISVDRGKGDGIVMVFMDSIFFDTGQAVIKDEAQEVIKRILPIIDESQDIIETFRIVGHTDNRPINTGLFRNNWWLSYYRAGNVLQMVLDDTNTDINPKILTAEGQGEYQPIATNDTDAGRAQNRRVEFYLTEINFEDYGK